MPPAILYPLINGVRYDWSSVDIKIDGLIYGGVKEISYSNSLEPGKLRGNKAQFIGRTRGEYSAEASITLYRLEYHALIEALWAKGGYMEVSFNIFASYSEAPPAPVITDHLLGCRIKKDDFSGSEGGDPQAVKLDLDLMMMLPNGREPISTNQFGRFLKGG